MIFILGKRGRHFKTSFAIYFGPQRSRYNLNKFTSSWSTYKEFRYFPKWNHSWRKKRHGTHQKRVSIFITRQFDSSVENLITLIFISTWPFGQSLYVLKNTKAFMCLKYVIFPVPILPNLAVKAFYVLIFSANALCTYFRTARALCTYEKWA